MSIDISIVTPIYGCPDGLEELVSKISKNMAKIPQLSFEIIMVNDRCPKNSWPVVVGLSEKYSYVKGINLSRNFGQHYAITAGLKNAKGNAVIVMDCDLQDPPDEIPRLIKEYQLGFDLVLAKRKARTDGMINRFLSYAFYRFLGYMTDTKQDSGIANFGIYSSKVIDAVLAMPEQSRLFPVMVRWVGFNHSQIEFQHQDRHSGESSYDFWSKLRLATDIIICFSEKPLWFMVKAGFSMSLLTTLYAFYVFIRWASDGVEVEGWTSVIISIWFLSGFIITFLGVLGVYLAKTYEETKQRPIYIVDEIISKKDSG